MGLRLDFEAVHAAVQHRRERWWLVRNPDKTWWLAHGASLGKARVNGKFDYYETWIALNHATGRGSMSKRAWTGTEEAKVQEQHDHRPTYGLDLLEMLVRERHGLPEGWVWHRARVLNDGATSISGAVAPVVNGKFERDRLATLDTYIVTRGEADAFAAEWERRTGGCHRCFGEGRVWAGTDKFGATRHSLCPRCGGVSKGKVA